MMNYTGVTARIMGFCEVLTGRMYGGLAQVNVLLSTLMGGLSGSNLADAAMEAKMLVPEMEKKGFSKEFSSVVTAASAMITPLIPPGISMILYGCIANVSIGDLFISGIGVGLLLCVSMMILVRFVSKKRGYAPQRTTRVSGGEFVRALKPAFCPCCSRLLSSAAFVSVCSPPPRPAPWLSYMLCCWVWCTGRCTGRIWFKALRRPCAPPLPSC